MKALPIMVTELKARLKVFVHTDDDIGGTTMLSEHSSQRSKKHSEKKYKKTEV